MKTVYLDIGRIVVEGLPELQQRKFARALEARLRAWAASGAVDGLAENAHVSIPMLNAGLLPPGATASQAAAQVVNSIARSLAPNAHNSNSRGPKMPSGGEARGHV